MTDRANVSGGIYCPKCGVWWMGTHTCPTTAVPPSAPEGVVVGIPSRPSVEQMIEEILEAVPDSEIVIGKGAAAILRYPPPKRNEERFCVVTGDPRGAIQSLHTSVRDRALYRAWRERE